MVRNALGGLLALVGAAAGVWGVLQPWHDDRLGYEIRLPELFTGVGVTPVEANPLNGLLVPMAVAALLTLVAVLLRSRPVVAFAGLMTLGFTVLWIVRQGIAAGSVSVGGPDTLQVGVGAAAGGGLLMLLGALVMRGRRPAEPEPEPYYEDPEPVWDPGPADPYGWADPSAPPTPGRPRHDPHGADPYPHQSWHEPGDWARGQSDWIRGGGRRGGGQGGQDQGQDHDTWHDGDTQRLPQRRPDDDGRG